MKRHLRAVLAGDIVGFSRLMENDEAGTIARQRVHFVTTIKPMLDKFDGRIVKLMGDGILVEFSSVVDAVSYAVAFQRTVFTLESDMPENLRLVYRVGINLGDVFYEDGDILGDGVNIAARLEQMADPGGICISGTVYDLLKSNIPVEYESLGEVTVKNIQQPIRVYRVLLHGQPANSGIVRPRAVLIAGLGALALIVAGAGWWGWNARQGGSAASSHEVAASIANPTPALVDPPSLLSDKPSIAVLPFDNMSGDVDQDYFSDGMTEDLITDLSQISGLFVLARNTVFTYKDKAVNVQQIGRELNVGYVLEGSVRRAGDRVRINAQLIDTKTGGHVWAARYDRDMTDVFALQDDVVQRIVAALEITLSTDEKSRLSHSKQIDPVAYDAFLRGLEKLRRFARETNMEAREFFEKAIAIEPDLARAHADLALTYAMEVTQFWAQDREMAAKLGLEIALKARELDPNLAQTYFVLATVYRAMGLPEDASAAARRMVELDPNYADGYAALALSLNYNGRPREALTALRTATRLNPLKPFFYVWVEGQSNYLLGEYETALRLFEDVAESNPHFSNGQRMLAATYAAMGRIEDAEWAAGELMSISPRFTLADETSASYYSDNAVQSRYIGHLREAGLE